MLRVNSQNTRRIKLSNKAQGKSTRVFLEGNNKSNLTPMADLAMSMLELDKRYVQVISVEINKEKLVGNDLKRFEDNLKFDKIRIKLDNY